MAESFARGHFRKRGPNPGGWGGGGGGGVGLIFSYIRRLGSFFFWGGFRKKILFLGMKTLWIFFWGFSQILTIFRGLFYAF